MVELGLDWGGDNLVDPDNLVYGDSPDVLSKAVRSAFTLLAVLVEYR